MLNNMGATVATTIRLATLYHDTGCHMIADRWFGSVKGAVALAKNDIYIILLVKTGQKKFPCLYLGEANLIHGEWVAYSTVRDKVKLQAYHFLDLKSKDSISTWLTSIPRNHRETKHHDLIWCPQVAEHYLKYSAAIDVHNHYSSGIVAMEGI